MTFMVWERSASCGGPCEQGLTMLAWSVVAHICLQASSGHPQIRKPQPQQSHRAESKVERGRAWDDTASWGGARDLAGAA